VVSYVLLHGFIFATELCLTVQFSGCSSRPFERGQRGGSRSGLCLSAPQSYVSREPWKSGPCGIDRGREFPTIPSYILQTTTPDRVTRPGAIPPCPTDRYPGGRCRRPLTAMSKPARTPSFLSDREYTRAHMGPAQGFLQRIWVSEDPPEA
jgi:hypothetical protein